MKTAKAGAICLLLCLIILYLGACAQNAAADSLVSDDLDFSAYPLVCDNLDFSAYPETVSHMLPFFSAEKARNQVFDRLGKGYSCEAFGPQAAGAMEAGIAEYWYPQYLATVVIAVDLDKTDADVKSWSDLAAAEGSVGFCDANPYELVMAAIAYGLEGEGFSSKKAAGFLAALRGEKRLVMGSYDQPFIICYDFQAAGLIKDGRNIEIAVPAEGTLAYEKGLLSGSALVFSGDVETLLLEAGFRLPDGRCDEALYPGAGAYQSACTISDFAHLNAVSQDMTRIMRREVLNTRLYTSADSREHLLFALVYIAAVTLWIASAIYRAMQRRVRRAVVFIWAVLIGWIIVRLIKYQMAFADDLNRYLWFSYYIFQLALPLALVWLAWAIDKPDDAATATPKWMLLLAAFNGALLLLVITNDLHNLVFRIDLSNPDWPNDYGYGPGYYFVQAGCYAPLAIGVVLLLLKGRQTPRKTGVVFFLALVGLLAAYATGYALRAPIAWESDYTMVIGLFVLLLMETCIRAGLIPVNSGYEALFANSPLGMRIVDNSCNTVMSAAAAVKYDGALLEQAIGSFPEPVQQGRNTLVYAAKIAEGHALWHEDISLLNRLHMELVESVRRQKAANAILVEEERIKRAIDEEKANAQLYEQLEAEIARYTIRLSTMIEQLENEADRAKATARITLLLCYIKRRCNLFFREKEAHALPSDELAVYLDELAEIAEYAGVITMVANVLKASLSAPQIALFYEFFFNVVFWASWLEGSRILVHLGAGAGHVTMRLLLSETVLSFRMEESLEAAIASAGGVYKVKDLDDASGLCLAFPEGGGDDD